MSLTQPETQALGAIADGLAGADPRLASMLTIFSRLAAGEEMPARQKTRARRGRPAARRPRRARRHPRRAMASPQPRRRYPRPGWPQAMLVLGAVICAALLTAALALTANGPNTCARPVGTACPRPLSHSRPARADADPREMTGAAAQLARPAEPRFRQKRAGFRAAALPALPGCQQIAEGGAQLLQSPCPGLFRPFGLDCGRHCLDAFMPPLPRCAYTAAGRRVGGGAGCGGPGFAAGCSRCCGGSGRRGTGRAGLAALPHRTGRCLGRVLVGAEVRGRSPTCWPRTGPGRVGRWGWADRPCGIGGLVSLWPLGRCRTGRVIPSVGGVPELPALPMAGPRDDRGREPE